MNLRTFEELIAEESTIGSQQELTTHTTSLRKICHDIVNKYNIKIEIPDDKSKYILWSDSVGGSKEKVFDIPLFNSEKIDLLTRVKVSKFTKEISDACNTYLGKNELPGKVTITFHTGYRYYFCQWAAIPVSTCKFNLNARNAKASDY